MHKLFATGLMIVAAVSSVAALAAEVQIPRTMADKGKYYLLDTKSTGDITATVSIVLPRSKRKLSAAEEYLLRSLDD